MILRRLKVCFTALAVCGSLVLQAHGEAPAGRYSAGSGTVKDRLTGLTWQQSVDPTVYALNDAVAYCQGLKLAGGGWRLPARKELLTLVDVSRSKPAIDPRAFPNTPSEIFWAISGTASSPATGSQTFSLSVDFSDGHADYDKQGVMGRIRCVR